MKENFYNRKEDKKNFYQRVFKEATHELGHTISLVHNYNDSIMRFSNRLEHTDNKPADFCNSCSQQISNFFQIK